MLIIGFITGAKPVDVCTNNVWYGVGVTNGSMVCGVDGSDLIVGTVDGLGVCVCTGSTDCGLFDILALGVLLLAGALRGVGLGGMVCSACGMDRARSPSEIDRSIRNMYVYLQKKYTIRMNFAWKWNYISVMLDHDDPLILTQVGMLMSKEELKQLTQSDKMGLYTQGHTFGVCFSVMHNRQAIVGDSLK
jgi:hypothetical protein